MAKTPKNHGKEWTPAQEQLLRKEIKQNTPTRVHAIHQGRTPAAIQKKASELGVSLKPVNQSPYGTKKKK